MHRKSTGQRYKFLKRMKDWFENINLADKTRLIAISLGFGALAWILDSLMDSLIFRENTVIGQLITSDNHEIAIRLLFGSIFVLFGIYIQFNTTNLKKTEDALKRAAMKAENEKNKTKEIIEAIGDGIILQDTDYKITYQNDIQNELYGNHIGEYCYKAYEGRDIICEDCPIERSFKDGKIHKTERKVTTDNGILYIELTGSPLKDSTGKIIGGVKVVRDITGQRRVEEALRESEEKYHILFEAAPIGIGIAELDGKVIHGNANMLEMAGYTLDDFKSAKLNSTYIDPEERKYFVKTLQESGRVRDREVRLRRGDGKIYHALLSADLLELKGHKVILTTARDITERKRMEEELHRAHDELELRIRERTADLVKTNKNLQAEIIERKNAEEALRNSEKKYHMLIDNIQDGVFIVQDGKVQFANDAAARICGHKVEEITGKDFGDLVAPEDAEVVADRYRRRQAGEEVPREYEFHLMHKDGRTRILANMNVGLITYDGRVASFGTLKDITEKKRLESQLLKAQRMESIGTLASGIAHDVNNVLTPIMLSQELLQEKLTDDESERLLNTIKRSTHRGADLMKQVLSFTTGVEGERNVLHIAPLISEIKQIIKETFPRNIEIKTDIPEDLWSISGDATQLHQVMMNLCVNARDAMATGGTLSISVENLFIDVDYAKMNSEAKIGPYVVTTVSDTGTGIPAGIMDRIFEPFFTTKEHGKGTGLGLSTSLGIVKSHGGFISVSSEAGKVTTFRVHLPAIKSTETVKAREHKYKMPIGHGESILVVDDEDQIREIAKKTLETHGYKVITCNNGQEAITLYLKHEKKINLVLMDMMMPVMDGLESIQEIRKFSPEARIIAVSGLIEKDKLAKVHDLADAFLPKPYTIEKLLEITHEILAQDKFAEKDS